MLGVDGHVRVVDFGLALAADDRQYDETRIGTFMCMAPELAKHRVQVPFTLHVCFSRRIVV